MKRSILSFEEITSSMQILDPEERSSIKGRADPGEISQYLSRLLGVSVISDNINGNWVNSINGGAWIPLIFQLQEVTITANGPTMSAHVSDLVATGWNNLINDIVSMGPGGGGGTAGGGDSGDPILDQTTLIASGNPNTSLYDIVGLMMTSLGTAATFADVSASEAKLESATAFTTASRIFGAYDVLTDVIEFVEDPNAEDFIQAGVGVVLIIEVGNPFATVGLGLALSAWELYEYQRDH